MIREASGTPLDSSIRAFRRPSRKPYARSHVAYTGQHGLHWLGVPVTFLLVEQRSSAKVRLAEPINSPVGSRNGCARIYLVALASNST